MTANASPMMKRIRVAHSCPASKPSASALPAWKGTGRKESLPLAGVRRKASHASGTAETVKHIFPESWGWSEGRELVMALLTVLAILAGCAALAFSAWTDAELARNGYCVELMK